jgi:hypothetical protein
LATGPLEAQAILPNGTISELALFRFRARHQETAILSTQFPGRLEGRVLGMVHFTNR